MTNKEEAMSMDSIFGSVKFFAIALLLSGFGVGFLGMGCGESNAEDSSSAVNVVIIDCGEAEDAFKVNDISSTDDVGIAFDEDCAKALKKLLSAGYQIVPGGGGAVHDSVDNNEHVLYTLTSR
jgi:hypothetical protein